MIVVHTSALHSRRKYIDIVDYFTNFDDEVYKLTKMEGDAIENKNTLFKYRIFAFSSLFVYLLHTVITCLSLMTIFLMEYSRREKFSLGAMEELGFMMKIDLKQIAILPLVHHYKAFVNVISKRLDILCDILNTNQNNLKSFHVLKMIKILHFDLCSSAELIHKFFNWLIFATFVYSFICLFNVCQIMVYVSLLIFEARLEFSWLNLANSLPSFVPITICWLICYNCQTTINMANIKLTIF